MLAFIDCYQETPANICVNTFIESTNIPSTYHMVSKFGLSSLNNLDQKCAYVILGSATHVEEKPSWQSELVKFIDQKLEDGYPVLGICYGHQLMGHYYGSRVEYINPARAVIKEARQITLKSSFWNYQQQDLTFAYAHAQIISELSDEFEELAFSAYPNEIIRHKTLPFFGIQAHPEASGNFLKTQTSVSSEQLTSVIDTGTKFLTEFYSYASPIIAKI